MKERIEALRAQQERATFASAREMDRIGSELTFAHGLCRLHPERTADWQVLLEGALARVHAAPAGDVAGVREAVAEAEALLAPIGRVAKHYTVQCVGHGHIDMNWMWSWPETVAVTNDTFGTVLRLMDEYPTFHFSQSQASVYAIVQEHNPEMLARIAARVREGRWEVTASHWVEGDKNLAGGESLCRHLLYTRRYMKDLFDLDPEDIVIDWSPDTFGHALTVPMALVRGGVRYLYLHRPGVHGPARPRAFWWQSPDGSRVLVRNDVGISYNGRIGPEMTEHLLAFAETTGCPAFMFVYGVGDHGGGPTRRDILRAIEMDAWPVFPNIRFAPARAFYETLEKHGERLPTLTCELNTEFTGCYTSQSLIKKANRFAENRLCDAELASVLAWTVGGRPYPLEALRTGWRDTLFSHFHDILPGSGVHDTRTYTHGLYQKTMAMTGMTETLALRALAAQVDTSGAGSPEPLEVPPRYVASALGAGVGFGSADGNPSLAEGSVGSGNRPFVVFNNTATERRDVVEATIWDNAPPGVYKPLRERVFHALYPGSARLPAQRVAHGAYWGHEYVTLAFPLTVPALGYTSVALCEGGVAAEAACCTQLGRTHHCAYSRYERSLEGLENEWLRVELDPATGGIRRLVEKTGGTELISPARPAPVLEYAVERPHGMTSWLVDHTGPVETPLVTGIKRTLAGPHKVALEVKWRIHESDFTLTYELRAGDPRLHMHLAGTWFQRGTPETGVPTLSLSLPLALERAQARYEIPFGAIDRDLVNGEEVPALEWAQVCGDTAQGRAGILLLNDSKHGHSLAGSTLRLSLIRASYDPDPLPEIGRHEMRFALLPFAGTVPPANAIAAARQHNHPLRVVGTDIHPGTLPAEGRFLALEPESLALSGVKRAEDSEALVVRVYETAGRATRARLALAPELHATAVEAVAVDVLERPLPENSAAVSGDAVEFDVPAHGLATVLVRLKAG